MKDESPVAAVRRILAKEFGIEPHNVQVMMLIDAVREALPPHPDATIASLRAILRDLRPDIGLEHWADRCSREIVSWLSRQEQVRNIARAVEDEGFWCTIEGTLAGMLLRVTRGKDLEVEPKKEDKTQKPAGWCDGCNGVICRCEQRA